jgi:Tol biopolymer transport system component
MATRRRLALLTLTAAAAVAALGGTSAQATYPGPNGRIAFPDYVSGQVYAVNPDGSGLVQLTHTDANHAADFPSWSPDGEHILFTVFRFRNADRSRIWIMDADGAHQHQLTGDTRGFRDYAPKYTPDASHIVFSRCQPDDGVCAIWEMQADGTQKHALTPYVHDSTNEVVDFRESVSPDGTQIAFARFFDGGFIARVFVMDADGSDPVAITPPRLEGFGPDWAPDGKRITFSSNGGRTGSSVFTIRPDGSDLQRVTPNRYPHNDALASYSPRGNHIAFVSDRNYPDLCCNDLFAINPNGTGEHMIDVGLSSPGILDPSWGTAPLLP